jgi:hypothetical protein
VADELREKVLSGRAWAELCDALKDVGALVHDRARRRTRSIAPRATAS